MHTGQYASSVPSDHGQRQALVKPLSLPGVASNVNKFLCETAQEGGSGLAIHTSGLDCNWLKVIIVKKVIVFPAFVGLSISCYTAWYSGTDYVITFCKGVHNCRIPYKVPASVPGVQGQLATAIRYLIYKRNTFLGHKVNHVLQNTTAR